MVHVTQPGAHRGRVPANKGKPYPAEVLTPDEVRALLAQCSETSSLGIRHRALITLPYRTGLRAAEALARWPRDVDLRAGTVAVLRTRGDRHRTIGIDSGACRIVEGWCDQGNMLGSPEDAPLFCTLRGRPMPPSRLRALLPRLALRCGIDRRKHRSGHSVTPGTTLWARSVCGGRGVYLS